MHLWKDLYNNQQGKFRRPLDVFFYNAPPNKLRYERGFFPLIVVHQSSIQCISKSDSSPACCCSACAWPCTRSRTRGAPPPRPPRRSCRTCASAAYTELEEPVTGRKSHLGIMRMWFEQSQQGSIFLQSSRVKKSIQEREMSVSPHKTAGGKLPQEGLSRDRNRQPEYLLDLANLKLNIYEGTNLCVNFHESHSTVAMRSAQLLHPS